MKRITGRLAERNGKWYAIINLYTTEGKRKEKWVGLDLEAKRGSKTEANFRLNEILARYNSNEFYVNPNLTKAEQEKMRIANLPLHEYLNKDDIVSGLHEFSGLQNCCCTLASQIFCI